MFSTIPKKVTSIKLRKNKLRSVQGLFKNINPEVIDLAYNNISSLEGVFHENMWRLKNLDISKNPIGNINSTVFANNIPNIRHLDLSSTSQGKLDLYLLRGMNALTSISLNYNHLQKIPSGFFNSLSNLQMVDIKRSSVSFIEGVFVNLPSLRKLDLSFNTIRSLSGGFRNLPKLTTLTMGNNIINSVSAGDLDGAPSLQTLDLSYNKLIYLSNRSFVKLKELRELKLNSNIFYRLNCSVQSLDSLEVLHLESGRMRTVSDDDLIGLPNLSELHISNNDIIDFGAAFWPLNSLNLLDISTNRATTLKRHSFPEKISLTNLEMEDNTWICDCRLSWLVEWIRNTSGAYIVDEPICAAPQSLISKPLRELTTEDLSKNIQNCPSPCECECQASVDLDYFSGANCSMRNMTEIPSKLPNNLGLLDLSNNNISNVTSLDDMMLAKLEVLNLASNVISDFNVSLPPVLRTLMLHHNKMSRPSLSTFHSSMLTTVTLSNNPWICDCDAVDFLEWLKEKSSVVEDVDDVRCGSGDFEGQLIINLSSDVLCSSEIDSTKKNIYIVIGAVGFLLLVVMVFLCWVSFAVKACLYSVGCRFLKREDIQNNKLYDGLLLYTSADRVFALETLAPGIEMNPPRFTLFIPSFSSDVENSRWISAVKMCARIIVVFSEDFLNDSTSMELLRTANVRSLDIVLPIIVQYGDLPPSDMMDSFPRSIYKSSKVVRWGKRFFWKKLKYLMPKTSTASRESYNIQNTDTEPLLA